MGASTAVLAGFTGAASAQLYVYEPFDYTPGSDLNGQNGGTGFSSAWRDASTAGGVIQSGSLTGPAGLPTSGGHALLSGELGTYTIFRDFSPIAGSDGTTTWISFIGQRQGQTTVSPTDWPDNPYPRGVNTSFYNSANDERIGVGNSTDGATNEWSIVPEGSGSRRASVTQSGVPYETLLWAVMRIDHVGDDTAPDSAYLWLNPDPTGAEPSIGSADVQFPNTVGDPFDYSDLAAIRPFVGNESSSMGSSNWRPFGVLVIDELRIGGDWASMSAVPEPSTYALMALAGGFGLLYRRMRRK